MPLSDYLTNVNTDADIVGKRIVDLSDRPADDGLSAQMLKAYFDYLPLTVVAVNRINGIINYLTTSDFSEEITIKSDNVATALQSWVDTIDGFVADIQLSGAGKGASLVGVNPISGVSGDDVQECLQSLANLLSAYKSLLASSGGASEIGGTHTVLGNTTVQAILDDLGDQIGILAGVVASLQGDVEAIEDKVGEANGIATLDGNSRLVQNIDASKIESVNGSTIPLAVLPPAVKIRNVAVSTIADMLALTISDVQNGDFVSVEEIEQPSWYQVIDDTQLGTMQAFRKVPTGVIGQAIVAQQYDATYTGGNSIYGAITSIQTDVNEKADKSTSNSVSLAVADWDLNKQQTVSVSGVTATNNIICVLSSSATADEIDAFGEAKVRATAQGNGTVTFTALGDSAPAVALPITIVIVG